MNSYRNALTGKIVENPKSFWTAEREERKLNEAKKNNTNTNNINSTNTTTNIILDKKQ